MALEIRGGKKYLYRSHRINGRVVKEYVGSGSEAEEAARREAATRAEFAELKRIGVILDALRIAIDVAIEEHMLAAGYHKPKRGPWRKRRQPKSQPPV